MDVLSLQNTEINQDEWSDELKASGWVWYENDKPQPSLKNLYTDATSSVANMQIRATKAGIDKVQAKIALEKRLPLVSGTRFIPSKPKYLLESSCTFFNTFKEYKDSSLLNNEGFDFDDGFYLPADSALQIHSIRPFIELIERLTSNNEDRAWLTAWIAHMIQKPEQRPSVHPLFRTEHGIGKNVLVETVLNKLLCKQTVTTSLKEIKGTHSESVANNLLVFVDESKAKGMNVYLELKSILTTSEALINPKHQRPYKQEIFSRFMFADNTQGRAFNIEQEDRRIYVMEYVIHEHSKEDTQEFIAEFIDWFHVHWELVYGYLLNLDISDWSPYVCPLTEAKKEYLGMCEDPVDTLLSDYISEGWRSLDADRWDTLVVRQGLDEQYSWSRITCTEGFKYQLEHAGFVKKRVGRAKKTGYFLDGLVGNEAFNVLTEEQAQFKGPLSGCQVETEYTV